MLKKCVALALVLVTVLLIPATVFAKNDEITVIDIDPETIVFPEEVIGYPGGSVSPDTVVMPPDVGGGGSRYPAKEVLFRMTATHVTDLLTTYGISGKSFYWKDIKQGEAVSVYGTLHFSGGDDGLLPLRYGVCYFDRSTGIFRTSDFPLEGYATSFSGNKIDTYFTGSGLSVTMKREENYGFIRNTYSDGYVYGELRFAIIDIP